MSSSSELCCRRSTLPLRGSGAQLPFGDSGGSEWESLRTDSWDSIRTRYCSAMSSTLEVLPRALEGRVMFSSWPMEKIGVFARRLILGADFCEEERVKK